MKKIAFGMAALMLAALSSCGGSGKETSTSSGMTAEEFNATQPVESGEYVADYYSIAGENARKGAFDGRVLFSLAPDKSYIYVYENGNRAKINYTLTLADAFEKNDSCYSAVDSKGNPVTVTPDSAKYVLAFERGESKISIDFDKDPKSTGTPMQMLERINKLIQK